MLFNDQISSVTSKLNSTMYLLRKYSTHIPLNTRFIIFNCLSACHIDYCLASYFNFLTSKARNSLNSKLCQCGRAILGQDAPISNAEVLQNLQWLSFDNRAKLQQILLIHTIYHSHTPASLFSELTVPTHTHNTRFAQSCLSVHRSNTLFGNRAFSSSC